MKTVNELMELVSKCCAASADASVNDILVNRYPGAESRLADSLTELRAALAGAGQWLPIDDRAKGRSVLIAYRNPLGKWRRVRAKFFAVRTLELSEDDPRYDDDAEENFAPGGWYELCENAETINLIDGTPELWCELPPLPPTTTQGE